MSKSHLINASIHRAKEGARVLEDIARFLLHDETTFHLARDIRHRLQITSPHYDVADDLGGKDFVENNVRANIISIIQANAMRLQEALRVLEEMMRTTNTKQLMKTLRYQAYDLYAKLYFIASKHLKINLLTGLYLIIDTDLISYTLKEIIDIINQSPVNIVQYRNKSTDKKVIYEHAERIKESLNPNKLLIINDHVDIALALGDGIHLGQNDFPLQHIRDIVPDNFIVGNSCHGLTEARLAMQYGASYLAIGSLFTTSSKRNVSYVSLQEVQEVCDETTIPVCAIGGIHVDNLDQVLKTNIQMVAAIATIWNSNDPLTRINTMHEKICTPLTAEIRP